MCINDDRRCIVDGDIVSATSRTAEVKDGETVTTEVKIDRVFSSGGRIVISDRSSIDIARDARVAPIGSGPKGGAWISVVKDTAGPEQ